MGPDDFNFPEDIPAIPEAGQSAPATPPSPPTEVASGGAMAPDPEVSSPSDGVATSPAPAEPLPQLGPEVGLSADLLDQDSESANWVEAEIPYRPKPLTIFDELLIALAEAVVLWRRWLRWLRSQLPAPWRRQLSDPLLTAILLGFGVVLLVLINQPGSRATPPLSAASPVGEVAAVVEPTVVVPAPPTPEENLITDLETQLSGITRSYSVGLIDAVEVNLPHQTLTIHLGESWYGLLTPQQDSIAQDIYRQAQALGLDRLTLQDPEGLVVARSPVVGPTMVVLQRRRPGSDLPPA